MNKTNKPLTPLKPLNWLMLAVIFLILAIYFGDHHIWILWVIFEIPAISCSFMLGKTLMDKMLR